MGICKQVYALDCLGRILAGEKVGMDWPVPVRELLHPRSWYSGTKAVRGCDWREEKVRDTEGAAQGN